MYSTLEQPAEVDPIVELVYNEINAHRVMTKLKMSGMNHNTTDPAEKNRNAGRIAYNREYEKNVQELDRLIKNYTGFRDLRMALNDFARTLHQTGKRRLWGTGAANYHCACAMQDFSRSIIKAFKKLPKN